MVGGEIDEKEGMAALAACWSCKGPVSKLAQFCHTCGAVQPPGDLDHFRRLGFSAEFDVDIDVLERRYIGLQRHLHPDRFVAKPSKERALAQAQAVSLNEAYETLRDPLKRAAYLLRLKRGGAAGAQGHTIEDTSLLMEVMQQRESLAEARSIDAVERLAAEMGARAMNLVAAISSAFRKQDLDEAERLITKFRYARKFLEETRSRMAAFETA